MKSIVLLLMSFITLNASATVYYLESPDQRVVLNVSLDNGSPYYTVFKDQQAIIKKSLLGMVIRDTANLSHNLEVINVATTRSNTNWEQPWGQNQWVKDNHKQFIIKLKQTIPPYLRLDIEFKVFNDGVGFRYYWPKQANLNSFEIWDENTEFVMRANDTAWWVPAFLGNRYEYLYSKTNLDDFHVVHTPVTFNTTTGHSVAIHEAALLDFASMSIKNMGNGKLKADLVPWDDGIRVKTQTPASSSWRTIQIGDNDGDLLESNLILNLNEPNKLGDVSSWVHTGKYIGIWWGMHLDKFSWGSGPKHGATTKNTKEYIDFAAKHGFKGILVEGWNEGWDGNWYEHGYKMKFTTPYPDYDIKEVTKYARSKGVKIVGHHETGAFPTNYENQLDAAFKYLRKHNMDSVKTGYVGSWLDHNQWHHGQYGVQHYQKVMKVGAKNKVMMFVHEPIKQTGLRRTYPNLMSAEGARGQEYNAWDQNGGNPPSHTTILPFTRLLAGPMDFTPGIFDLTFNQWKPHNRVNTTLAKQLALYVVIYSPWQMAADLPENYEGNPAFQFIKDVPTDWSKSIAVNAKIGEYVTFARKDKNSDNWYLGSITNEKARTLSVPLNFLDKHASYEATIYTDGKGGHWEHNPYLLEIKKRIVTRGDSIGVHMAPGGGTAVQLRKIKK